MSGKKLLIAGVPPGTGNLGVNALCYSTVAAFLDIDKEAELSILSNGNGIEKGAYKLNDGRSCDFLAAKHTLRFYQSASYINIRNSIKLGPLASTIAKKFKSANALLDISAGDSFTELYGPKRFKSIVLPKMTALENNIPLIMLPQTYGPFFDNSAAKKLSADLIAKSTCAYARDKNSFNYMKEMLGSRFNPEVHKVGVDVAFMLPTSSKEHVEAKGLLPAREENKEVYGINVSGLIYNDPDAAKNQYGLTIDYKRVLIEFINQILANSDGDIWLVPHVLAPEGHYESDNDASFKLRENFPKDQQERIKVVTGEYDQCEIKGVIAQCDWFCGTRMHSTVASLSNAVPTVALAYSGKTKGVFETAGQEDYVIDSRHEDTDAVISKLYDMWTKREAVKIKLEKDIDDLKARSRNQMMDIYNSIPG